MIFNGPWSSFTFVSGDSDTRWLVSGDSDTLTANCTAGHSVFFAQQIEAGVYAHVVFLFVNNFQNTDIQSQKMLNIHSFPESI